MKRTKSAIFKSVITLLLCISMLIGTTFAWFVDSAISRRNIIQTGKLDAKLHWSDNLLEADSDEWIDATDSAVFTNNNWEPGYTEVKYIKVSNDGSLNFKWRLTVEANGPVSALADVIDVYYVNPVTSEVEEIDGLSTVGTLSDVMLKKTNSSGSLAPDQETILAIAFHMDSNAGNEYENMSLCESGFSLKLLATQDVGEYDSFGNDYDKDAEWEDEPVNFNAYASVSQIPMIYGTLASDITIGSSAGISAKLPAGVKVANDATRLELTVRYVDTENKITLSDGDSLKNLDVHISGIAEDNTVPMIVNLGAILLPGLSDTEVKLYHTENGAPVQMTRVDSANDFAIHNQYTYDVATGDVSIYVASFSVFSALQTSADVWNGSSVAEGLSGDGSEGNPYIISSAAELIYFRDQVDSGRSFAGEFVKLTKDIDLANHLFNPIGYGYAYQGGNTFNGTFDGNHHTIYNIYENGWELESATGEAYNSSLSGAGLFASLHNATIINLSISGVEIVMESNVTGVVAGSAQGVCTFENIVVSNVNLGNYQMRNGGIVGDVYLTAAEKETSPEYSHVFTNIVVDSTVKLSSLWGDFDNANGGVIGAKYGYSKILMQNVIVAAEIDAFSDVTAAYQWYAYRRCGMLLGYTGQNSPKQATNAAADFLTCENVKVFYGDWSNYTYYQFADQDSDTGRRYPWVRVEAGEYNAAFSNPRYGVPTYDGVKVTDSTHATANVEITFGQLYGGGQGVYGCNEHLGVTIATNSTDTKTIYIQNNKGWENLSLKYWFRNGDDIWTTNVDGVSMESMETAVDNIYKITLPAYADSFAITANGGNEATFILKNLKNDYTYSLDGVSTNVATVNGKPYATLEEAIAYANGGTVVLESNVVIEESIIIDGTDVTINLNGKTVSAANNAEIVEVLLVKNNANVTITGNGTMIATGEGDDVEHVEVISAIDGAKVKIENGTFISEGCTAVYATRGAIISIYDGTFEAKEQYYGKYYTLDVNEREESGNYGQIIVFGGTYVNFNPAQHSVDGSSFTNKLANDCFESIYNESEKTYTVVSNHEFVDGTCHCGAYKTTLWQLVTDATSLKVDDKIVIVAVDYNYALSTNQATNNRTGAEIIKNIDGTIIINENVQIITLVSGTAEGTFGFYTGAGYLYAASSGSNHLKTQTTNNANGEWTITITDGVSSIIAKNSSNRNVMQYNPNNGSPLFSCYSSASQKAIAIYKLAESDSVIEAHDCARFADGATCDKNAICTVCSKEVADSSLGHKYESVVTEPTCIKNGYTTHTCTVCGKTTTDNITEALGHNFDGNVCSVCGEVKAQAGTKTYTFSNYTAGTQYAENEEHVLDENTTVFTTECHFTSELRIYASSTNNGYVIIQSTNPITSIGVNAGYKADTLNIYVSNDGVNWSETPVTIAVTSTSYKDYSVELSGEYKYLKLDVAGSNQIRLQSLTLTTIASSCSHTNTTEKNTATCTEAGVSTTTCNDCGETISEVASVALGHTTENGTCERCNETIGGSSAPELTEKTYSYTFTAKQYSANGTKTLSGVNWTLAGNGGYWGYDNTKGQQFGSGSNPYKSMTLTSTEFSNVSKIVINTSGASSISGTLKVYVGTTLVKTIPLSASATSYTIDVSGLSGEVKLEYTQTSSKAIYLKSIKIDYAE